MNSKIKVLIAFIAIIPTKNIFSQRPANYNDVIVIVNSSDSTSLNIGSYFKTKRNIRANNIISISMPTQEEISDIQFQAIRKAIQDSMIARNLVTTTNYIVTTKGVPLKICRDASCITTPLGSGNSSSFDSELMLMFGPFQNFIGSGGSCGDLLVPGIWNHPYYLKNTYFDSQKYGIYLATRLTAWTQQQVYSLIDSSGPNIKIDKSKIKVVFDGSSDPSSDGWNQVMATTKNGMASVGFTNIVFDTTDTYIRNQSNVLCYWGFGDQHTGINRSNAAPGNTWAKGSVACLSDFYTARSFSDSTASGGYNKSLIADWVREGTTGISGLTYNSYMDAWTYPYTFLGKYTSSSNYYNLAEAYYIASPSYSWHFVVVGDPKTSIYYNTPPAPDPWLNTTDTNVCIGSPLKLTVRHNIASSTNWFDADSSTVKSAGFIYDFTHPNWIKTGNASYGDTLLVSTLISGIYKYTYVAQNITAATFREIKVNVGCSEISENNNIEQLSVYPNPTKNEANIQLKLNQPGNVTISVIDMCGKTIAETIKNYSTSYMIEKIDMSPFTKGIYIIKIHAGEDIAYSKIVFE